jgi:hypothetical protein
MQVTKLDMILISTIELYPHLENKQFNSELSRYEDFFIPKTVYRPTTEEEIDELSKQLCNAKMELAPYQLFVRNFLSNQTPYNGLLLYHGLGTGKTCSAITISEEYRDYLKQTGKQKHIYILGGENIRSNFRKQLFQPSHLHQSNGVWTCTSCVGNKFLQEIDPLGMSNLTRDSIETQIHAIIRREYIFMGYKEFANRVIEKITNPTRKVSIDEQRSKLTDMFEHCMIVIDEVHNIKNHDLDQDVVISPSKCLDLITQYTVVKLVLLSATPMFNVCSEIIWLSNLLNRNDKREELDASLVFKKNGDFVDKESEQILIDHLRGYVSFVKGENPFTFPYRIYPESPHVPKYQINKKEYKKLKTTLYPVLLSEYQYSKYNKIIETNQIEYSTISMKLCNPILQTLNMTFPGDTLKSCMTIRDAKYTYNSGIEECFSKALLSKYSAKIHSIISKIENSIGIVLVYTQFIDQGVIPMALALESIGFSRYGAPSLMNTPKKGLQYCLLTGDHELSPIAMKERDIQVVNSDENYDGQQIKVILITQSASEGVDLKNIRQIHIMDPWWHMNRNEQIIGRGIRLCSHKKLPFRRRNAEIYLYASMYDDTELLDMYMYRFSEEKAIKVGKVTRLLKENAIDCFMNHELPVHPVKVNQELSTLQDGKPVIIPYVIGDRPYSVICDYMKSCDYSCKGVKKETTIPSTQISHLKQRVKNLFKRGYVYSKQEIMLELNKRGIVTMQQVNLTLSQIIDEREIVYDIMDKKGWIINHDQYYLFQPIHLNESIMPYERRIPSQTTNQSIVIPTEKVDLSQDINILVRELTDHFSSATKHGFQVIHIVRGEKNWYKCVNACIRSIQKLFELHDIHVPDLLNIVKQVVVSRIIEMLIFKDCLRILNYVYSTKKPTEFDTYAKEYFETSRVTRNESSLLCLWDYDKTNVVRYVVYENNEWKPLYIAVYPKEIGYTLLKTSNYGTVVGGIVTTKNNDTLRIVKTKEMMMKSYGTNIIKGKDKVVREISSILPDKPYYTIDSQDGHSELQVVCEEELLLRILDKIKYKQKRWFLYPYECILNANNEIVNFNR